jgi:hypothetical protein
MERRKGEKKGREMGKEGRKEETKKGKEREERRKTYLMDFVHPLDVDLAPVHQVVGDPISFSFRPFLVRGWRQNVIQTYLQNFKILKFYNV